MNDREAIFRSFDRAIDREPKLGWIVADIAEFASQKRNYRDFSLKELRSIYAKGQGWRINLDKSSPFRFKFPFMEFLELIAKTIDRLSSFLGPEESSLKAAELLVEYCKLRKGKGKEESQKPGNSPGIPGEGGKNGTGESSQESELPITSDGQEHSQKEGQPGRSDSFGADRGQEAQGDHTEGTSSSSAHLHAPAGRGQKPLGEEQDGERPGNPTEVAATDRADDRANLTGENLRAEQSGAATPASARDHDLDLVFDHRTGSESDGFSESSGPLDEWGGMHGPENVVITPELKKEGREIAQKILRLIKKWESEACGSASPRWSGCRLVRELASRRYAMARARRQELEKPLVVLVCDQSGSCAAVCKDTKAAAIATAQSLDRAILLNTSNEFVYSEVSRGKEKVMPPGQVTIDMWASDKKIGLAILWADTDGTNSFQKLCEDGVDIVWFDSYCCNLPVRPASRNLRKIAASWKRQPLAWYQGVKTARDTIIALKLAERKI